MSTSDGDDNMGFKKLHVNAISRVLNPSKKYAERSSDWIAIMIIEWTFDNSAKDSIWILFMPNKQRALSSYEFVHMGPCVILNAVSLVLWNMAD